ncbi:MAG: hypothetical protein ACXWJZ_01230 [Burkholderiaceae bacterium]
MNNQPPTRDPAGDVWSQGWIAWFQNAFECLRWKKSFNYIFIIDFPNVLANTQSAAVAKTINGVRTGDAVSVTPLADTAGLIYKGIVTADDTVSLYACNFTASNINPASTTFRIIVLQD